MELMTIEESVKFFKVKNRRTIDNWLYTGALPRSITTKIGNKVYFIRDKVEDYIKNKTA